LDQNSRLYRVPTPIVGLTGGIASGKSTVSQHMLELGLPIICADTIVKEIYRHQDTFDFILQTAPKAITDHKINFQTLRKIFFSTPAIKHTIESYIYPRMESIFLKQLSHYKNPIFVVYDVPLLFEHNLDSKVDITICVSCDQQQQIDRIMSRDKITKEEAQAIIKSQMPLKQKAKMANYVITNDSSLNHLKEKTILALGFIKSKL